jgi:hypothetical protein
MSVQRCQTKRITNKRVSNLGHLHHTQIQTTSQNRVHSPKRVSGTTKMTPPNQHRQPRDPVIFGRASRDCSKTLQAQNDLARNPGPHPLFNQHRSESPPLYTNTNIQDGTDITTHYTCPFYLCQHRTLPRHVASRCLNTTLRPATTRWAFSRITCGRRHLGALSWACPSTKWRKNCRRSCPGVTISTVASQTRYHGTLIPRFPASRSIHIHTQNELGLHEHYEFHRLSRPYRCCESRSALVGWPEPR